MSNDSQSDYAAVINNIAVEFDEFCQSRHDMGAKQYGPTAFLKNNMFQMMAEELADLCNYARYMYIKLRLMETIYDENSTDLSGGVTGDAEASSNEGFPLGSSAMVGAGGLSDLLQSMRRLPDPR